MLPLIPFVLGLLAGGVAVKTLRGKKLPPESRMPLNAPSSTANVQTNPPPDAATPDAPPATVKAEPKPATRRKRATPVTPATSDKKPASTRKRAPKSDQPAGDAS